MENLSPYKMMHNFVQSAPIEKFVQKKNGFDYLPWSIAYHYAKTVFPTCKIIKEEFMNKDNVLVPYMLDAEGYAFVKSTIIWEGFETSEIFPITDFRNQSIKNPTSKDVDNALQRCMTKCVAMFCGLGLQLWHGEDLPVSAGLDNSRSKAERGEGDGEVIAIKSETTVPQGALSPSQPSEFKKVGLTIEQEISMCPDMDTLKSLYNRSKGNLTEQQVALFTARKQELING